MGDKPTESTASGDVVRLGDGSEARLSASFAFEADIEAPGRKNATTSGDDGDDTADWIRAQEERLKRLETSAMGNLDHIQQQRATIRTKSAYIAPDLSQPAVAVPMRRASVSSRRQADSPITATMGASSDSLRIREERRKIMEQNNSLRDKLLAENNELHRVLAIMKKHVDELRQKSAEVQQELSLELVTTQRRLQDSQAQATQLMSERSVALDFTTTVLEKAAKRRYADAKLRQLLRAWYLWSTAKVTRLTALRKVESFGIHVVLQSAVDAWRELLQEQQQLQASQFAARGTARFMAQKRAFAAFWARSVVRKRERRLMEVTYAVQAADMSCKLRAMAGWARQLWMKRHTRGWVAAWHSKLSAARSERALRAALAGWVEVRWIVRETRLFAARATLRRHRAAWLSGVVRLWQAGMFLTRHGRLSYVERMQRWTHVQAVMEGAEGRQHKLVQVCARWKSMAKTVMQWRERCEGRRWRRVAAHVTVRHASRVKRVCLIVWVCLCDAAKHLRRATGVMLGKLRYRLSRAVFAGWRHELVVACALRRVATRVRRRSFVRVQRRVLAAFRGVMAWRTAVEMMCDENVRRWGRRVVRRALGVLRRHSTVCHTLKHKGQTTLRRTQAAIRHRVLSTWAESVRLHVIARHGLHAHGTSPPAQASGRRTQHNIISTDASSSSRKMQAVRWCLLAWWRVRQLTKARIAFFVNREAHATKRRLESCLRAWQVTVWHSRTISETLSKLLVLAGYQPLARPHRGGLGARTRAVPLESTVERDSHVGGVLVSAIVMWRKRRLICEAFGVWDQVRFNNASLKTFAKRSQQRVLGHVARCWNARSCERSVVTTAFRRIRAKHRRTTLSSSFVCWSTRSEHSAQTRSRTWVLARTSGSDAAAKAVTAWRIHLHRSRAIVCGIELDRCKASSDTWHLRAVWNMWRGELLWLRKGRARFRGLRVSMRLRVEGAAVRGWQEQHARKAWSSMQTKQAMNRCRSALLATVVTQWAGGVVLSRRVRRHALMGQLRACRRNFVAWRETSCASVCQRKKVRSREARHRKRQLAAALAEWMEAASGVASDSRHIKHFATRRQRRLCSTVLNAMRVLRSRSVAVRLMAVRALRLQDRVDVKTLDSSWAHWAVWVKGMRMLERRRQHVVVRLRLETCLRCFERWHCATSHCKRAREQMERWEQRRRCIALAQIMKEWNRLDRQKRQRLSLSRAHVKPISEKDPARECMAAWSERAAERSKIRQFRATTRRRHLQTILDLSMAAWRRHSSLSQRCTRKLMIVCQTLQRNALSAMQWQWQNRRREERRLRLLASAQKRRDGRCLLCVFQDWICSVVLPLALARQVEGRRCHETKASAVGQWKVWTACSQGARRDVEMADRACILLVAEHTSRQHRHARRAGLVAFRTNWRRSKRVESRELQWVRARAAFKSRAAMRGWLDFVRGRSDCTRCLLLRLSENISLVRVTAERTAFARQLQLDLAKALRLSEETDDVKVAAIETDTEADSVTVSVNISRFRQTTHVVGDLESRDDTKWSTAHDAEREKDVRSVDDVMKEVMDMVVDDASTLRSFPSTVHVVGATACAHGYRQEVATRNQEALSALQVRHRRLLEEHARATEELRMMQQDVNEAGHQGHLRVSDLEPRGSGGYANPGGGSADRGVEGGSAPASFFDAGRLRQKLQETERKEKEAEKRKQDAERDLKRVQSELEGAKKAHDEAVVQAGHERERTKEQQQQALEVEEELRAEVRESEKRVRAFQDEVEREKAQRARAEAEATRLEGDLHNAEADREGYRRGLVEAESARRKVEEACESEVRSRQREEEARQRLESALNGVRAQREEAERAWRAEQDGREHAEQALGRAEAALRAEQEARARLEEAIRRREGEEQRVKQQADDATAALADAKQWLDRLMALQPKANAPDSLAADLSEPASGDTGRLKPPAQLMGRRPGPRSLVLLEDVAYGDAQNMDRESTRSLELPPSLVDIASRLESRPESRFGSRHDGLSDTGVSPARTRPPVEEREPILLETRPSLLRSPLHSEHRLSHPDHDSPPVQGREPGRSRAPGAQVSGTSFMPNETRRERVFKASEINPTRARHDAGDSSSPAREQAADGAARQRVVARDQLRCPDALKGEKQSPLQNLPESWPPSASWVLEQVEGVVWSPGGYVHRVGWWETALEEMACVRLQSVSPHSGEPAGQNDASVTVLLKGHGDGAGWECAHASGKAVARRRSRRRFVEVVRMRLDPQLLAGGVRVLQQWCQEHRDKATRLRGPFRWSSLFLDKHSDEHGDGGNPQGGVSLMRAELRPEWRDRKDASRLVDWLVAVLDCTAIRIDHFDPNAAHHAQIMASDVSGSLAAPRPLQRWSTEDSCLVEGHSVEMLQAVVEQRASQRLEHSARVLRTLGGSTATT